MPKKQLVLMKQTIPIIIGTAIYAFGIHFFIVPNELTEGGVTGISLLFNYAWDIPLSLTTLVLNIPLFYFGWRFFGWRAMSLTIIGTLSLTFFLWVMEIVMNRGWLTPITFEHDFLLAALYAGLTLGTGLGIVFRFGGTTGGVDILARIGNKKLGWSMGQIILMMDTVIIGAAILYIPLEKILYTLVLVFITSRMIDLLIKGTHAAKAFMIITDHPERIRELIYEELSRGVTFISAKGAYSGQDKQVVYSVVYRQETRKLTALIHAADPQAFIIVSDVQSVFGEGFEKD